MEQSHGEPGREQVTWGFDPAAEKLGAPSVLLVEDDPDIRAMLTTLLELGGFRAHACDSAEAALDTLREQSFDLVLTDYCLPRQTGLWMLEAAESERLIDGVPVLIVTAHPWIEGAGQYEIVQKPFDLDHLLERVRQRMDTNRPRRARTTRAEASGPASDGGSGGSGCPDPVELILYISSHSPHPAAAVRDIKQALARFNPSKVKLTVRNLTDAPESLALVPPLEARRPAPRTFIVGHLSNPELVLEMLADCNLDGR